MSKKNKSLNCSDDEIFFHDLMNQIHSFSLFLAHKKEAGSVNQEEITILQEEITQLKNLVQTHFSLGHRNAVENTEWISFDKIQNEIVSLTERYLPQANLSFQGNILINPSECFVHANSFMRILTNMLKNIAENSNGYAQITFNYDTQGLTVKAINDILPTAFKKETLGLGIVSMKKLAKELEGHCSSLQKDSHWETTFFLPIPALDLFKKVA